MQRHALAGYIRFDTSLFSLGVNALTIYLKLSKLSSYRNDLYRSDFVSKWLCIEMTLYRNGFVSK